MSAINSEVFKRFMVVHVDNAIEAFGGLPRVRELHRQISMIEILTGWICAVIIQTASFNRLWRQPIHATAHGIFTDELRHAQDYIRLRIETESSTS